MSHFQIPLKHWSGDVMVDEKISGLVWKLWGRAMQTTHSCQGNYHKSPAYLMFDMIEDAWDFMTNSIEATGCFDFDLSPFHGETGPRGRVTFPTELIEKLEAVW